MHAMLALGASHLDRVASGNDHATIAMVHRGQAIRGLNEALAKSTHVYGEADAMLASCYALTFQSSCMGDGLMDFITMVRGCALVTDKIRQERSETAFLLRPDNYLRLMEPRLTNLPAVDSSIVEAAVSELEAIESFPRTPPDREFYTALLNVVLGLRHSPKAGYLNFVKVYTSWCTMDHDNFKSFADPSNLTSQLLLAYFAAIMLIVVPLMQTELPDRARNVPADVLYPVTEWIEKIFDKIPCAMRVYLNWPMQIKNAVHAEIANIDVGNTWKVLRLKNRFDCQSDTVNV